MALSRAKYRRVTELYSPGTELELMDGSIIWLKTMNPFERDEAQRDAQLAKSRLVMALRGPHSQEERDRVEGQFLAQGSTVAIRVLADGLANEKLIDIVNELKDDPDWKERVEQVERSDSLNATTATEAEVLHLSDVTAEYLAEVQKRIDTERDYQVDRLGKFDDVELLEEWIEHYINRRGGSVATAEYNLTEAWYGARVCDAVKKDDGTFDHSECEGHKIQVFETKQELREAPEELQDLIGIGMRNLGMTVRDARFLAKPASSSESSPAPSEVEESTASTPTETPATVPGT